MVVKVDQLRLLVGDGGVHEVISVLMVLAPE
jgi:hypothetical protein